MKEFLKNRENIFAIFLFLLLSVYLFFVLGIVKMGFGIIDDHQIYSITQQLENQSFTEILKGFLVADNRFRIFYWINRIFTIKLFGTNYFLYYFEHMLFALFSVMMLYFVLKKFKINSTEAILLSLFPFCGSQISCFWELGTNELYCSFLLIASVFFCVVNDSKIFKVLGGIFFSLSVLAKETFIIAAPFVILFFLVSGKKQDENYFLHIKRNLVFNIFPILAFLISFGLNCYAEKTNITYEICTDVGHLWTNIKYIFNSTNNYLLYETIIFIIISLFSIFQNRDDKNFPEFLKYWLAGTAFVLSELCFLVLITSNNVYRPRYIFPLVFGTLFLFCLFLRSNTKKQVINWILVLIVAGYNIIAFDFNFMKYSIINNIEINNHLISTRKNMDKNAKILLIGDAFEKMEDFEAFKTYYNYYGYSNLYAKLLINIPKEEQTVFQSDIINLSKKRWKGRLFEDFMIKPDLIIIFSSKDTDKYDLTEYKSLCRKYLNPKIYVRKI